MYGINANEDLYSRLDYPIPGKYTRRTSQMIWQNISLKVALQTQYCKQEREQ